MALIKSQSATTLIRDAVVLDLGDLGRQAQRLKEAARERAREILDEAQEQARREAQAARQKAFDEGKAAGLEAGLEQGRKQGRDEAMKQLTAQFQSLQQQWLAAASAWESRLEDMDRQARTDLLDLSLRIARAVVHRTVEHNPAVVADQLAAALRHVLGAHDVRVTIHPEDRPFIDSALPQIAAAFPRLKHITIVEDAQVGRGGCVVSAGQGQVDATIDTQVQRLVDLLLPSQSVEPSAPLDAKEDAQP